MPRKLLSLLMLAAVAGSSTSQPAQARSSLLDLCFDRKVRAVEFSGVALVTDLAGRPLLQRAAGWKDLDRRQPLSHGTMFNVASISKLFTAVAVLQLVDAGKLRLDDPVGKAVSGLPADKAAITLRQLLLHRSGLGDYNEARDRSRIAPARTASDLLPLIVDDELRFAPGAGFRYSNNGFVLLGAAIERASGLTYADYLQRHVFTPARMSRSSVSAPREFATPLTNVPYGRSVNGRGESHMVGEWGTPATGAYSTAADLVRFVRALNDGRLLKPATFRQAISPQDLSPGREPPPMAPGLGFATYPSADAWGHSGGMFGVSSDLTVFTKDQRIVAVLSNYDPPAAHAISEALQSATKPGLQTLPAVCTAPPRSPRR